MGHEAITIFMDLMHHNPILTILLLLLRYPNFLPGLIPFHMLRRISLNELVRVINFILQAIQDQLRRFEQRQIRTEIANAGIANTETIAATALNTAAAQNVQIQAQAVAQNTQIQANAANAARNPFIIAFRRTMTFLTSPQGRLLTGVGTLFALANYQGIATGAVGFYEVIRELLPRDLPQIPPGMPRIEGGGTGGGGTGGGGTGIPVPPTEPGGDSTTKELLKNIWKLVKSLINHLSK